MPAQYYRNEPWVALKTTEVTQEEFDEKYTETLDDLLLAMAENSEVDQKKIYHMTCLLENLRFFSPVIYGMIKSAKNDGAA